MEFVTTREELRTIYKTPRPTDGSIRKELKALDGHSRSFIGKSRSCLSAPPTAPAMPM